MTDMYRMSDMVFARTDLSNDGTIPDVPTDAPLAAAGARGVVVKIGHIDRHPEVHVYLVRFEGPDGTLGPPVGCFTEELTQDEAWARETREQNVSAAL